MKLFSFISFITFISAIKIYNSQHASKSSWLPRFKVMEPRVTRSKYIEVDF